MTKWLWQLKWALVIAIFAGPAFAYYSYKNEQRINHVLREGAPPARIEVSARIGITQAADWPLRFYDADSRAVSVRRRRP